MRTKQPRWPIFTWGNGQVRLWTFNRSSELDPIVRAMAAYMVDSYGPATIVRLP